MFTAFPLRDKTFSCRNEQKEITQTSRISLKIIFIVQEPKTLSPFKILARFEEEEGEKKAATLNQPPRKAIGESTEEKSCRNGARPESD